MIKKITISNIKGIGDGTANGIYEFDIPQNKPIIFVAPNGYGKSSLATTFKSLGSKKIELEKNDYFQGKSDLSPRLEISYSDDNGNTITAHADSTTNKIIENFDYFVINNQVFAKSRKHKIRGQLIASASLETLPILLYKKAPEKITFNYSIQNNRGNFGKNGKALPNIKCAYENGSFLKNLKDHLSCLDKSSGKRIGDRINSFKERLNEQNGSKENLLEWIDQNEITFLQETQHLSKIAEIFSLFDFNFTNKAENYLASLQIISDFNQNKDDFKKALDRKVYELDKSAYERLFDDFNSSWSDFKPIETSNGELVVQMPKIHHISNGQRDVMCFIALLKKAELHLKKKRSILIIDEVFDYLDDANLIAVQYYVTQLIAKFKDEGKMLYPIILTHLDPAFFRNYTFSNQKIFYLEKRDAKINCHLQKLLVKRDDPLIRDNVSKYHLHYEPNPINIRADFETLEIKPTWGDSSKFDLYVFSEFEKYISDNPVYDPFAVCCALRKKIEKYAYDKLVSDDSKLEFLSTHKTPKKLDFAESKGISIPESFYLLGIIYNDGLHWKNNEAAISGKLENIIIKKMIKEIQ